MRSAPRPPCARWNAWKTAFNSSWIPRKGALTLAVPDPSRVQIRNAGSVAFEFVCGPQEPRKVLVEYAPATAIVRGLEFR